MLGKKKDKDDELMRVSASEGVPSERDESSGGWWNSQKLKEKSGQELPQPGPWPSTSSEELQRFKTTPFIGKLGWGAQYAIAVAGLFLSALGVVAGLWMSKPQDPGVNAFVESVSALHASVLSHASSGLEASASQFRAVSGQLGPSVQAEWNKYEVELLKRKPIEEWHGEWKVKTEGWQALFKSNDQRRNSFKAFFEASNHAGAGPWYEQQRRVDEVKKWLVDNQNKPTPMPETLSTTVQEINQQFANFSASGRGQTPDEITSAWRDTATLWATVRPELEKWLPLKDQWNASFEDASILNGHYQQLIKAANAVEIELFKKAAFPWWGWLSLGVLMLFLGLLWSIGLKQSRWQILHAKALNEQYDAIIFELIQVIGLWASGDWTLRAKVSENPVGTLADSLNQMMEDLRRLFMAIKTSMGEMSTSGMEVSETTGVLVDNQRQRTLTIESGAKDILRFIESVRQSMKKIQLSSEHADQIQARAMTGRKEMSKAQDWIVKVAQRMEESNGRVERLNEILREMIDLIEGMHELSEQIGIAGMQAALHASRAGESGRGFKVVADTVQSLASSSTSKAKEMGSMVDTIKSDLEALMVSVKEANVNAHQTSDWSEEIGELWLEIDDSAQQLSNQMEGLIQMNREQEQLAGIVDERAQKEVSQIQEAEVQAQKAAEGVLKMVDSVHELERAVTKFKV